MGVTVKVSSVDHGLTALRKRCEAKAQSIRVGIDEAAGENSDGKISIADLAAIHEFGLGVPQRPFITSWAEEHYERNKKDLTKVGQALVKGKIASQEQGLLMLAEKYAGEIQAKMSEGIPPPLAEGTRRAGGTPLIDTGTLRSSIAGKVE